MTTSARFLLGGFAIALLFPAAPVIAAPMPSVTARGQAILDEFATCLVARQPAQVSGYLARFPDPNIVRATALLGRSPCLSDDSVRLTPMAVRGALYRSLYRARFGQAQPAAMTDVDYARDAAGRSGPTVAEYVELRRFASCVVAADRAGVHAVLLASPATQAETRAFATLSPRFGPCLVSGVKASFSREAVIGLLAEAAYRSAAQTGIGTN